MTQTLRLPQPIPYQGSKRNIVGSILYYFPTDVDLLVEPFAGSAAVSVAAAQFGKARKFHLNDINEPLMSLWKLIINEPEIIAGRYEQLWRSQVHGSNAYYDKVRAEFNLDNSPEKLLYLLARCVKSAVRYNSKGEFNQSPDKRRRGKKPMTMRKEIFQISSVLKAKTTLTSVEYQSVFRNALEGQLFYIDPPYQGVSDHSNTRYLKRFNADDFAGELSLLNEKRVPFILSYDGRRGLKKYGIELPSNLNLKRVEINAGRSSQATLMGQSQVTYESIYLSPELLRKLGRHQLTTSQPLVQASP